MVLKRFTLNKAAKSIPKAKLKTAAWQSIHSFSRGQGPFTVIGVTLTPAGRRPALCFISEPDIIKVINPPFISDAKVKDLLHGSCEDVATTASQV